MELERRSRWDATLSQTAPLGDHEGKASLLWKLRSHASSWDPRLQPSPGRWEAGEDPSPAPASPWEPPQPFPRALGDAFTSHHMSMLVVCVVVPKSSSGARYLRTQARPLVPCSKAWASTGLRDGLRQPGLWMPTPQLRPPHPLSPSTRASRPVPTASLGGSSRPTSVSPVQGQSWLTRGGGRRTPTFYR